MLLQQLEVSILISQTHCDTIQPTAERKEKQYSKMERGRDNYNKINDKVSQLSSAKFVHLIWVILVENNAHTIQYTLTRQTGRQKA